MSERSLSLKQKRSALRAHCAIQRAELSRTASHIESSLLPVDRGIDTARRLATHPAVLAGGVVFLAFLGPKRVLRWLGRGTLLFTTGNRIFRLLR